MKALFPEDELERLEALWRYRILDTPPDVAFDRIAELAAGLFRVPMAMVSLVDQDRIWFKSHHGIEAEQVVREAGLCASAILAPEVYHIRDAIRDVRAKTNPLVAGPLGVRFYAAAPLRTHDGFKLGALCVADREPRELSTSEAQMLTNFAELVMAHIELRLSASKVAELEQAERRISEQLSEANKALVQSEERFRDLFDEAPIAYVHEGLDSRFIQANRTALRILGLKPEEIAGTFGNSFVPDTADAQRRLCEALDSVGRGTDTSGVVLELRRKDNGKPVWIQWWSRPATDGDYTRTMFVDITERVLIEQE
ncbi:MAG TPA: PAS domain S-box protein, partial [Acidobacteriaceae bacterium]